MVLSCVPMGSYPLKGEGNYVTKSCGRIVFESNHEGRERLISMEHFLRADLVVLEGCKDASTEG